jgi:hypothetical protein
LTKCGINNYFFKIGMFLAWGESFWVFGRNEMSSADAGMDDCSDCKFKFPEFMDDYTLYML